MGGSVVDLLSESFIGDDRRPKPEPSARFDSIEAVEAEQKAFRDWEEYHFPRVGDSSVDGVERFLSRPYLATMVMGTTGWSGWHEEDGRYWQCAFDDLSDDGKSLYRQIEKLYPGCDLHLLTFLDT